MNDTRMEEIFALIETAQIVLDPDPIKRGPKFLNTQVAQRRNLTNTIQEFEREAAKHKLDFERSLSIAEAEYDMKYNEMMSHDPTVMLKTSVRDREALVKFNLSDTLRQIAELKRKITDIGHIESVINSKLRELRDIGGALKLQIRLIESEIKLGNYWGDQSEAGQHHIGNDEIDIDHLKPSTGDVVSDLAASQAFEADFLQDANNENIEEVLDEIIPTEPSYIQSPAPRAAIEIDYDDLFEGL